MLILFNSKDLITLVLNGLATFVAGRFSRKIFRKADLFKKLTGAAKT